MFDKGTMVISQFAFKIFNLTVLGFFSMILYRSIDTGIAVAVFHLLDFVFVELGCPHHCYLMFVCVIWQENILKY